MPTGTAYKIAAVNRHLEAWCGFLDENSFSAQIFTPNEIIAANRAKMSALKID